MSGTAEPQRLVVSAIAPQPWKNGAGQTRELALRPRADAPGDFDWRLSIAEVARDAPFSAFPGIDRCITLIDGEGMRLTDARGTIDHALATRWRPFRFAGEASLRAVLFGGPCSDFNVMTRRGAWRSDVSIVEQAAEAPDADATLLLGLGGEWSIDGRHTLAAGHALLWRAPRGVLALRPTRAPGALLLARLCQHEQS